jgi:DNA-binding response OmpR family regulator
MPNQKILIVEDEKDLIKVLKYNLEKEGYKTIIAQNGEAGLTAFKKEKPDLGPPGCDAAQTGWI